jgi:methylthioribulose-1-phosphate dehydratase
MPTLAARVAATSLGVPGYLIAGHGLYAFGADLAAAERHVEAFEFLFSCELWRRR